MVEESTVKFVIDTAAKTLIHEDNGRSRFDVVSSGYGGFAPCASGRWGSVLILTAGDWCYE